MSTTGFNPQVPQGLLNRVLTNIVVPSFPQLSVSAPFMAKSLAVLAFDDDSVDQIGTATGVVNSPMPYVMATVTVNMLRSQPIAGLYIAQKQLNAVIGTIIAYPDSDLFPEVEIQNCSLLRVDPGPYDGTDPTVKATIKGVFYTNAVLWSGI